MKQHRLLDGRTVDLRKLGEPKKAFLRDLKRMARQDVSYFEVYRTAIGPGSLALGGRNRIDQKTVESPLYLVARDIATQVGIKQGLVLAPEHEKERVKASSDASMISVAQAAEVIGISRAAIYKAIEKKAIKAERVGNVTVVEQASAVAYRDSRLQKQANKKKKPRATERSSRQSEQAAAEMI